MLLDIDHVYAILVLLCKACEPSSSYIKIHRIE